MPPADLDHRLAVAVATAREAGELARQRFTDLSGAGTAFKMKGHQDYVTATDSEVERLIKARLLGAFSGDTMLGEEDGGEVSARTWVVDPIDGTANFARRVPHFCVSIALVADGRAEIGVVYAPMIDEMFVAATGRGATLNGAPITVSATDSVDHAILEMGWGPRHPMEEYLGMLRQAMSIGASCKRSGSGALSMAYVAAGRADACIEIFMNSWDVLGGLVLVREAGGRVNDYLANDGLTKGNRVFASAPGVADRLAREFGFELA